MRFRLHTLGVTLMALALLTATGQAQEQPAQPAAPATGQQAATQDLEKTPQAPIEPVMSGPYPVMSKAAEDRARQIFQMYSHGETSQMWASLSEGLRKASGKEERFAEINKKYRERMGPETSVVQETILPNLYAPDTVYERLSNFANVRIPITFIITVNQRGQIDGFDIKLVHQEVAEGKYAGYEDTAKLKLPFNGEWLVYQGGRTPFDNAYALDDNTRYGMEFAYVKNGRLFTGPGGLISKNEDYYCFGQPILAPFDGTVSRAEAGYDDNPPGRPSGDPPDGNLVVITHEEGDTRESALMNHLKQNSLKVKRGDKVKQGDVVAECGNSGAGPVPHLHFQFQKSAGTPLPAQFVDYIADGKPVASGEPKRGQFVKNAPSTTANASGMTAGKAPAPGSAGTTPPTPKPGH